MHEIVKRLSIWKALYETNALLLLILTFPPRPTIIIFQHSVLESLSSARLLNDADADFYVMFRHSIRAPNMIMRTNRDPHCKIKIIIKL